MTRARRAAGSDRPLLIIFLIVFVNLIGFGIIIPLLPFYATQMGASAFTIGLLFASYSVAQLIAAPVLGGLSDRWGRRPVLIFSLLGTVISFGMLAMATSVAWVFASRIVDGLSGGNISTARAYIGDVTTLENRAKGFGLIGAAFGLGFIVGPALGGALGHLSYAAPAWGAALIAAAAAALAWAWLPETVHRPASHATATPGAPWTGIAEMVRRPVVGRLLVIDFLYWMTFAAYQTTFALFGARRFGFDVPQTGYLLAVVGALGVMTQLGAVGPVVRRFGEARTLAGGLALAGLGLLIATLSHSVAVFAVALVPGAVGVALAIPSLTSLISQSAARDEQGRVQGVSSALEGLGRSVGPVWGNGLLGYYSEGAAFGTAAAVLFGTALLATRVTPPENPARDAAG
ncbi:MAG: MFS transporter [Armatimonadota bacterium]|nr:MFS transporter [Armatimonadota bacterium]